MKKVSAPQGLAELLNIDLGQLMLDTVDSYINVLEFVLSSIPDNFTVGEMREIIINETRRELIKRETADAE